jgi:hypothetical protein
VNFDRCVKFAALGLTAFLFAASAAADPAPEDLALAEALFRDGKTLGDRGEWAAACDKFAASQRLAPKLGTLLNLAACHEKTDRLVAAWSEFTEAAALAEHASQEERVTFAREHLEAIGARLAHVVVRASAVARGETISLGGRRLPTEALGTALPFDPGTYTLRAEAPGRRLWTTEVQLLERGAHVEVSVPELGENPPVVDAASPEKNHAPPVTVRHRLAQATAGVGALGLTAGGLFAAAALVNKNAVTAHCVGRSCSQAGLDAVARGRAFSDATAVALVVGALGLGAGLALFMTEPATSGGQGLAARARIVPVVADGFTGLVATTQLP